MTTIGSNLRLLRKDRDLSQAELAAHLGVHQTHVGAIERDEKRPSLDLAVKIAKFFNVPLDEMVTEMLEPEPY